MPGKGEKPQRNRGSRRPPDKFIHEFQSAFAHACDAIEPMREGMKLLLGCSGGGDSMALLEMAAIEAPSRRWTLVVAHLDHAQRAESAEEARFVAARCQDLGIRLLCESLRAKADPPLARMTEETMRAARHAFFHRALQASGAETIILAHQADDRAETFLMRLLSGSGPTGLASIRAVEEINGLVIARPLLAFRREALRDYLREKGLAWRDDPSNDDIAYKRAWVRREVMPLFNARMELDVVPRIVRASELAEEESEALDQACGFFLEELAQPARTPAIGRFLLRHGIWRRAGLPLRRRLLREWIWRLRTSPHPPGYAAVEEALKFAERARDESELRTVERIQLIKRRGELVAYPRQSDASEGYEGG